mmetsp:Transcript_34244/g.39947  ORF Transcript_34244/g.39947 Transcript_34244/m.39947 type:complete len:416 (+) Transcript_34244:31-1278(+)|eukprot:CAMPEP_0176435610 /NCGR_PEP_ID=MMETSP0127-20121128/17436_1 /TAXON_ID=938130 /ORGANISM="Platyophrya macrostoma, Strain WH" /LENGTH=415 /DNA_ID=CAMNT_0017818693 /DNA_START=22 /DNA_END=1269 /DNA_ORIENTATION=-
MSFLARLASGVTRGRSNSQNPKQVEESKTSYRRETETERRSREHREVVQNKVNVATIYNKKDYKPVSRTSVKDLTKKNDRTLQQFRAIIDDAPVCSLEKLKQLSWSGVPQETRSVAWKLLFEYIPLNRDKREAALAKKRAEYDKMREYYLRETENDNFSEKERQAFRVIEADVHRTQPDYPLFHVKCIQAMLVRILTIWHLRHPASGYVQGMNDLTAPLLAAFLLDYINIDYDTFNVPSDLEKILSVEKLHELEADMYFCLCKILEGIQDNYTNSQPGTYRSVARIRDLLKRIDKDLLEHLETNEINLMQIVIRWVFCLLIREFPLKLAMRLFDTYISDDEGFTQLHSYISVVLLTKWSPKIKKMQFHEIMLFLQNLPTKEWSEQDINMVIAEAYVYKSMFEFDTKHKPVIISRR